MESIQLKTRPIAISRVCETLLVTVPVSLFVCLSNRRSVGRSDNDEILEYCPFTFEMLKNAKKGDGPTDGPTRWQSCMHAT